MLAGNEGTPYSIRKASSYPESFVSRQAAGLLTYSFLSGRLPERLCFQWHSDQREELTAAGTARDLHPIPY